MRKGPCYLFNPRSALRREQSVLPQASAPCLDGLVRGCVFAKHFSSIILFFFRSSLALFVLMNLVKPAQVNLVSTTACSIPLSIWPITDRTQGWKQHLGTPRESSGNPRLANNRKGQFDSKGLGGTSFPRGTMPHQPSGDVTESFLNMNSSYPICLDFSNYSTSSRRVEALLNQPKFSPQHCTPTRKKFLFLAHLQNF